MSTSQSFATEIHNLCFEGHTFRPCHIHILEDLVLAEVAKSPKPTLYEKMKVVLEEYK